MKEVTAGYREPIPGAGEKLEKVLKVMLTAWLAVGISLAMVGSVNIWLAAAFIGICTCLLSALGVKIGNVFGSRYEKKAEFVGGVILILLGVKILLEHLGVLA